MRDIRSNLKGLLQSAEVMVEQCHLRSENIDDSKLKSIRRVTELSEKRPVLPQMQNRKDSQAVQKIYLEVLCTYTYVRTCDCTCKENWI